MGAQGTGGGGALRARWGRWGPWLLPSVWSVSTDVAQASGEGQRVRHRFSENECPAPSDGKLEEGGLCSHVLWNP